MYFSLSLNKNYKKMWNKGFCRLIMKKKSKNTIEMLFANMFKRFKQIRSSVQVTCNVTKMLDKVSYMSLRII